MEKKSTISGITVQIKIPLVAMVKNKNKQTNDP